MIVETIEQKAWTVRIAYRLDSMNDKSHFQTPPFTVYADTYESAVEQARKVAPSLWFVSAPYIRWWDVQVTEGAEE